MENIIFIYPGGDIEHHRDVAELPGFLPLGTSRQAIIKVPYTKLVEVFREPNNYEPIDGDKVDAEWCILTWAGVATIYNYKDGKNYLGDEGASIEKITNWHIGGHTPDVVPLIRAALGLN